MSTTDFPALPDYQGIRNLLDTERKTLIKIHSFAENDDYLRTNEDAEIESPEWLTRQETKAETPKPDIPKREDSRVEDLKRRTIHRSAA